METWLNRWINNYVLGNPEGAGDELKARYPLAWAEIKVQDVPQPEGVSYVHRLVETIELLHFFYSRGWDFG